MKNNNFLLLITVFVWAMLPILKKNKFDMKVEVKITDDAGNIRQYVVSGMLPTDEEIINEAEGRYPVKTHSNPNNSPFVGTQKAFIHGVQWALSFVQGNFR